MIKKVFALSCHKKLIEMLIKTNFSGSLASNLILPLVISGIFYKLIPTIYIWLAFHLILLPARIYICKKMSYYLKEDNKKQTSLYLNIYTLLVSLTAILYGYIVWQSVLYAQDIDIFLMGMVISSIVAGSVATLVSIFHIFALFVILQMVPFIAAFLYHGGEIFILIAVLATVFLFIIIANGYKQFKTIKETILLKESFESRVNDVTQELKQKNSLLMRQSKLAAMGEIIDAIAHQWKQPLNAISMNASYIESMAREDKSIANDDIIECYNDVDAQITHLTNTLDEFRRFFRPNTKKELVNLRLLINSALTLLRDELLGQQIEVEVSCEDDTVVDVNSNDIIHLILTIVTNAKDEMLKSGIEPDKRKVKIDCYTQDNKIIMKIRDSGKGIPKDIINSIFKINFTTKAKDGGTGMGLYMCSLICDKYGATIKASNENGAVFTVAFKK